MKNVIKASQLPVQTLILRSFDNTLYYHISEGMWMEMAAKEGRYRVVYNRGAEPSQKDDFAPNGTVMFEEADMYFLKFEIMAVPLGWSFKS